MSMAIPHCCVLRTSGVQPSPPPEVVAQAGDLDGLTGAQEVLELARAADLPALLELAGRRGENPVADRAHDQLRAVARTADLAAVP